MRANYFIRIFSVLALATFIAGSAFAQGKGRGGGGGQRGGGPPPGQQRQGGGGQGGRQMRQQPQHQPQRQGGGGGGQQRQQMQVQRQQMQRQQMQRPRQQMQVQRQQQMMQRQQVQRQQMDAQRAQRGAMRQQQMQVQRQQRQQMQRQQMDAERAQRDAMRQQMRVDRQPQLQRQERVRGRGQQDMMRQQMQQQREWQVQQRQVDRGHVRGQQRQFDREQFRGQQRQFDREQFRGQQRQFDREQFRGQPRQPNFGPVRRDQDTFGGRQYRDSFRTQERADLQTWRFERPQRSGGNFARAERDYYRALREQSFGADNYRAPVWNYTTSGQPYYYNDSRTVNVYLGDDYSDYNRYRYFNVYQPTYTVYDYYYPTDYFPLYRTYVYDEPYYGYSSGYDWKTLLFRSVIAAFFSNGDNVGYLDPYPRYTSYNDDSYYGYIPAYSYQAPYYTFGYTPNYAYYEPASYYGYDQYVYDEVPYDYIGYPSFPYNDMVELYSGGVGAEIIQRAMAVGYYQGLLEGQNARRNGWGDDNYYDPYLYEQTMYDPYSSSIGDCRRYMSEGYEMGYADALGGRDEFYLANGGDIDLVSLLVGSTVIMRS